MPEFPITDPAARHEGRAISSGPTRWSLILASAEEACGAEAIAGLTALAEQYLIPLYVYVRRVTGFREDAEDVVHSFWASKLPGLLARADASRGSFRGFLKRAVDDFIRDWADHEKAGKRDRRLEIPIPEEGEQFYEEMRADGLPPDRAYDLAWVNTLVSQALDHLEAGEETEAGRLVVHSLTGEMGIGDTPSAESLASALGISRDAVYKRRERLRDRMRAELRRLMLDYCPGSREYAAECEWFFGALKLDETGRGI